MEPGTTPGGHLVEWRAMGTGCRTWLLGPDAEGAARMVITEVRRLEERWSRFRADSDISRVNTAEGSRIAVAPETIAILREAIAWWRATEGLFDPTVLKALVAAGYDRDFAVGHGPILDGLAAPGCTGIVLDDELGLVQLPPGVAIDLGGIGKGSAVDHVVGSLRHLDGGLIDLGGDLRVWGDAPTGDGWPVAVEDLRDGTTAAVLWLAQGAVATSSTLRRAWADGGRTAHHLIDPRTGRPVRGEVVSVTVVAGRAAAAEVLAKASLTTGTVTAARRLLEHHGVAALIVPRTGSPLPVGGFDALRWSATWEVA